MENTATEKKKKSPWKIVGDVAFWVLAGFLLVLACLSITLRATGGHIGDSEYRIVISGSMDGEKKDYPISTIPVGSLVKIQDVPSDTAKAQTFYSDLKEGDVLTFHYFVYTAEKGETIETITHRIIKITETNGVYTYVCKGDAVEGNDVQTLTSDGGSIIGKVTYVNHGLGVFYTFQTSKTGMIILIIVPCFAVCAYEVGKIIYIITAEKKEKAMAKKNEQDEKDRKIKELEEQLAKQKETAGENRK
jgi:signal peptidase I